MIDSTATSDHLATRPPLHPAVVLKNSLEVFSLTVLVIILRQEVLHITREESMNELLREASVHSERILPKLHNVLGWRGMENNQDNLETAPEKRTDIDVSGKPRKYPVDVNLPFWEFGTPYFLHSRQVMPLLLLSSLEQWCGYPRTRCIVSSESSSKQLDLRAALARRGGQALLALRTLTCQTRVPTLS